MKMAEFLLSCSNLYLQISRVSNKEVERWSDRVVHEARDVLRRLAARQEMRKTPPFHLIPEDFTDRMKRSVLDSFERGVWVSSQGNDPLKEILDYQKRLASRHLDFKRRLKSGKNSRTGKPLKAGVLASYRSEMRGLIRSFRENKVAFKMLAYAGFFGNRRAPQERKVINLQDYRAAL